MSYAVRVDGVFGFRSVGSIDELLPHEVFSETIPAQESPTAPTPEQVRESMAELINEERDRRIDAGVTFNGVLYQSKATDRENIAGAAQMAFMAVVGGVQPGDLRWSNPDQDFAWICAENNLVPMDAQTVVEFGRAAALRKSDLIYAGRALKDLPEIPENFTDDAWWPA